MQKSASTLLASARLRPCTETAKLLDIPTGLLTPFVLKASQESCTCGSALGSGHPEEGPSAQTSPLGGLPACSHAVEHVQIRHRVISRELQRPPLA